ncbi:tRNA (adenosine(37)-N6)-threonylcarbamoyltransferase complex dimerization subunit type 1 TsaB [Sphingomonas dokdonensis]|uniref:tRNA threonylcarbamoyladenosine biosynthesis protein TsaB n=1 Tax=Sphingomonas dokdonensis TaxID=344880 RepID=A0A245ZVU5_9SPHN|nr:tRNA (adenosine(37)-N6)-threonylcarbamoyltransferase complex dimerization subunit type 1 TsaB [Sphingomonas dokdonensis]OWK33858.1 tRNA threonylcarbamoyladenosine biosynthesis protein TsaB [Sphingomonas dokdonensis]
MPRTLVIDTATAACSVALLEDGHVVAARHDVVGRGHAERLVPMIAALPDGGRAGDVLVDVGPGSFTGIRVGIAAARALGLGWGVPVRGYSSLALIAAAAFAEDDATPLAVVLEGGHGEVFMQGFTASPLMPTEPLASLRPEAAIAALGHRIAVGNGVRWLTQLQPELATREALPEAAKAHLLPPDLSTLPARPLYGRAPDAKLPA